MKKKKESIPATESIVDDEHLISSPRCSYTPNQSLPLDFIENTPFTVSISTYSDAIVSGDCELVLKNLPENSVDLIVTSPPYADQRTSTYGGISPDHYVQWFLPKTDEFLRVLKPTGSFILNIKERVVNGERHTYVMELVLAMRKHGWYWIEEYLWHKKNSHPGKWPNRFRDNWEHLFHFAKQKKFSMYQNDVMVPVGDWAQERLKKLSDKDKRRDNSQVGSGFGKNISNWVGREMVYPSNVLHMATECYNRQHSATFPVTLPEWFIKLFTKEGDLVLDPFNGSGTTCVAAKRLHRHYLGIDLSEEYCQIASDRIENDKNGNGVKKENGNESTEY
jgi:site-specific DNA-methyltransferase (adenine-specific)